MLDLQFELITANLFDPNVIVKRGSGAHAFLPAPYGIYQTLNGYMAIAMTPIPPLGKLLSIDLNEYEDPKSWWSKQEEITNILSAQLSTQSTDHWLEILDAADIWCAPVLSLPELIAHDGFKELDMVQTVLRNSIDGSHEIAIKTTRSPMRIDGKTVKNSKGAPHVGRILKKSAKSSEYRRSRYEESKSRCKSAL